MGAIPPRQHIRQIEWETLSRAEFFRAFRIVMYFPQLLAARDRHGRGAGCGGRGGVLRAMGSQGGFFEFVSDQ